MEEASVAGESPDRSKQRESSAEPTSGTKGPVPEPAPQDRPARDPRLSVARETDTSETRGGVDTATRVFSVRDLKKAVEEAGGTSGERPEAEETAAERPEAEKPEAEGAVTGETAAERAEAGESAAEETEAERPEAEGVATGETVAERSEAAGESAAEEPEAEGPVRGETAAERREAEESAAEEPRAGESAAEEPGAAGATGGEGEDSEAEGAAAVGADAVAEDEDSAADDAAATAGDEGGDARLRAAVAAWVRSGDSKGSQDSEEPESAESTAEADEDGAAEPEAGADADSDVEAGAAADSDEAEEGPQDAAPEPEADTASAADARAGRGTAAEPDGDAQTAADAATGDEPGAASGTGGEPKTRGASETRGASGTAGASGTSAGLETGGASGTGAEPKTGDGSETGAEPKGGASETRGEPGTGGASEAGGEPGTAGAAEADGDPVAARGPAVADGEGAPKGPSAADDESGTGGAGGSTETEGEAEVEDKPVDQPTAIFKRPKPQVDQPTTMLKLGGAKTPEPSEAERTSKFVALKPLDEPRTPRRPADATAPVPQVGPERTAQQPLPPKPPLDLLAELTNTPPPPQTPVRTIIRRVKIWTPLVLLLAIIFAIVQSVRPLPTPTLALTADDSYTFDGNKAGLPWPNEGQGWMDVNGIGAMDSFGKQTAVPIGSVAKAMTAYIVLKDHPLKQGEEGKKITVDALAEKEGGYDKQHESTLNTVKKGDVLTEKQALSAIMIPSANNIARLLARWDMGSEAAFIKKMNDTAKELGMKNTTYTDASGLKESTVSTAEDQVKLGNELVKIPALMDITKLPYWFDPSGKKWKNYNALVPFNGAIGIKTGTTTKAGGNLLFAATKEVGGETVTVVGAILDQQTAPIIDTVNNVSRTAMLAARDALTSTKILKKGDVVGYVDDQLGGHTPIVLTKDVAAVGWAGLKVKLSFDADDVPHTAKAGTTVGTLTVGDGTSGAVKVPVALQKDLTEPGFTAKLKRLG
ncbi:D-alanyl-D-alanine carboxypeptidase [Streptomyces sp. NPDC001137]|uniref:D-alanyl-D-alanine carboxypeptidase n=1 Tax=Streptomyces sp. NPDC001137 TaxID=3154378 RepID=UPI00331AECB8